MSCARFTVELAPQPQVPRPQQREGHERTHQNELASPPLDPAPTIGPRQDLPSLMHIHDDGGLAHTHRGEDERERRVAPIPDRIALGLVAVRRGVNVHVAHGGSHATLARQQASPRATPRQCICGYSRSVCRPVHSPPDVRRSLPADVDL